jgi:hypothetical protein
MPALSVHPETRSAYDPVAMAVPVAEVALREDHWTSICDPRFSGRRLYVPAPAPRFSSTNVWYSQVGPDRRDLGHDNLLRPAPSRSLL